MVQPLLLLQQKHVPLAASGSKLRAHAPPAKAQLPIAGRCMPHVAVAVQVLPLVLLQRAVTAMHCVWLVRRRLRKALRAVLSWRRRLSWQQRGDVVERGMAQGTPSQTLPTVAAASLTESLRRLSLCNCLAVQRPPHLSKDCILTAATVPAGRCGLSQHEEDSWSAPWSVAWMRSMHVLMVPSAAAAQC